MSGSLAPVEEKPDVAGDPVLTRVLDRLGFDRFNHIPRIPDGQSPIFWYAVCVAFLETVVLQAFNVLTGRPIVFFENPLWLVRPVILLGAALATDSLIERYDWAVTRSNLLERAESPERFEGLVPDALSRVLIAVGIGFTLVNAVVVLTIPQSTRPAARPGSSGS